MKPTKTICLKEVGVGFRFFNPTYRLTCNVLILIRKQVLLRVVTMPLKPIKSKK